MKLLVARHGETAQNLAKKFYGGLDVPLDKTGQQQAQQLAQKLAATPITGVIRSDLQRAAQTLAPIQAGHPACRVVVDADLNEKRFGNWENLDADEIQAADPLNWQRWLDAPLTFAPPTVEGFPAFQKRVSRGLWQTLDQFAATDTVLLVAHLGTLRVIYQELVDPTADFWAVHFDAGAYSTYDVDVPGKTGRLVALNV